MKNFSHIISFSCAKQLLELMRLLVTCLKRNFAFKKIDEIILIKTKPVRKLMSYFSQFNSKLLLWVTNLGLKRNGQDHRDSRYIWITFFQKKTRNFEKDQCTSCPLKLHLLEWNLVQLRKERILWAVRVHPPKWSR